MMLVALGQCIVALFVAGQQTQRVGTQIAAASVDQSHRTQVAGSSEPEVASYAPVETQIRKVLNLVEFQLAGGSGGR